MNEFSEYDAEVVAVEREIHMRVHSMFRDLALKSDEPTNTEVVRAVVEAFKFSDQFVISARERLKHRFPDHQCTVSIDRSAVVCSAFACRYEAYTSDMHTKTREGMELVGFVRGVQFLAAIENAKGALDQYMGDFDGVFSAAQGAQVLDQLIPYPEDEA